MSKIRVLVVDDSALFRRMVTEELSADPALEVVGTAANGKIALTKLSQVKPDVVLLDVEMPELDGLATLREIRKKDPRLPVIMFSALTERGATETLEALSLGATEYFTKPAATGGLGDSLRIIRDELIPEIKAICGSRVQLAPPGQHRSVGLTPPSTKRPVIGPSGTFAALPARVDVVAVAASTGGPSALTTLFAGLPADLAVPVLIVQHMPPVFTGLLAQRLSAQNPLPIAEGLADEPLAPGRAWLAPGDYHMGVERNATGVKLVIERSAQENSCRPAADVLFRSVARVYGPNVLAVVLTGMGQDGLRGCEAVKAAGGQVVVQDEATSVVWGMPGFVSRAGLADKVLPLALIAPEIVRRLRAGREAR